jgi:hypothetical protein
MRSCLSLLRFLVLTSPAVTLGCNGDDLSGPATGSLQVTTTTTGTDSDLDGYTVQIDAGPAHAIGAAGSLLNSNLSAGNHTVQLAGVAPNCGVAGENPRSVGIAAGETTTVAFQVTCGATVGQWATIPSGTDFDFFAISGEAATDIFTVGNKTFDLYQPVVHSVVMHFDGKNWSERYSKVGLQLNGVWTSREDEVFAVGDSDEQGATLLRFDGTVWAETSVPQLLQNDETVIFLSAVWGSSASDVFAVGSALGTNVSGVILHYDGEGWSRMTVPVSKDLRLTGVWGNSAQSVYAVGWSPPTVGSAAQHVLHYDGLNWTTVYREPAAEGEMRMRAVWTSADGHVVAVGDGLAVHYNGASWFTKSLPSTTFGLYAVWGASAADVYTVSSSGAIYRYDGTGWTEAFPSGRVAMLRGVWGSSATEVFAVGEFGAVLHGSP